MLSLISVRQSQTRGCEIARSTTPCRTSKTDMGKIQVACPRFHTADISHPYRTTGHTSVLTNIFLRSTLILLVSSSFLLLNASFASQILVLTSSKHLTSSEINEPRYLNLLTCSTL